MNNRYIPPIQQYIGISLLNGISNYLLIKGFNTMIIDITILGYIQFNSKV